jgi:DNA-binding response OmpR family regulator
VLIVEDTEYFREIAAEALSTRYEVEPAANLSEARAAIAAGGIDLMVLDLTLEGGDHGIELLRTMGFKPCPILIFTEQDESEIYGDSWEELRRLGADDVVIKGMNAGESLRRKASALLGEQWDEED